MTETFRTSARVVSGDGTANRCSDVEHKTSPAFDGSGGRLESDLGPEVYKDLLAAFLAHLLSQRGELSAAVELDDIVTAQGVAHQLMGTASSFGAARLDGLAKQLLEMDGADRPFLRSLVGEIHAEIDALHAAVGV